MTAGGIRPLVVVEFFDATGNALAASAESLSAALDDLAAKN